MKKKFFGFISVLMMATMLVSGCNNAEPVTYPDPEPESVATVDNMQPEITEPEITEPDVVEPAPVVEEPVVTPEDTGGDARLACLEVSEEFAKQNECLCLYRKGHLYSLGPYVPYENASQYYIGQVLDNSKALLLVYMTGFEDFEMTISDAPFIYLEDGDELRDYKGWYTSFERMQFEGYALTIWETPNDYTWLLPYINKDPIRLENWKIDQLEIHDESGNLVENRIGLNQGAKYIVSWYNGVKYNEQEMWAESQYYTREPSPDESWNGVNVSSELTKNGYAIVNWQEIEEPGIYGEIGGGGPVTLPFRIN